MIETILFYFIPWFLFALLCMGAYLCYLFIRIDLQILITYLHRLRKQRKSKNEDVQEVKKDLKEDQKNIVERLDKQDRKLKHN